MRQTKRWMSILGIQALVFIFSLASMMSKVAAQQLKTHGLLSVPFVASLAAIFAFLAIYAFFWQKILARVSLSVAYLSKAVSLIWTLVWSYFFFQEPITGYNIIGMLLILVGLVLINSSEASPQPADKPDDHGALPDREG